MTCTCPKCSFQIEFDPTELPSEGSFNKCSECGASFVLRKESFARRALHKGAEISCSECGSNPGASIYCQHCHAMYPDFLIIETSSASKRQLGKIVAALNALKNFKLGGATKIYSDSFSVDPLSQGKAKAVAPTRNPALLFLVLVVIIALSAGGGYYWYQEKEATKYTGNYVRALLGIKLARDLNIKISGRLSGEMKTGASTSLTANEQKSATAAKNDVDALMQRLDKIPAKFTPNNESLKKLYDSYSRLHTAVTSPAGSSDLYSAAVKGIDDDFRKSARELKSGLPEKISAQLSVTSKKFKALQDL
jgi:DNA-directed RNA polymerase subunit RPC12/RpoP